MLKRFFKNISQSFCIYLLASANLFHAIQNETFDWLLWLSMGLVGLSLILALIDAIHGGDSEC